MPLLKDTLYLIRGKRGRRNCEGLLVKLMKKELDVQLED